MEPQNEHILLMYGIALPSYAVRQVIEMDLFCKITAVIALLIKY